MTSADQRLDPQPLFGDSLLLHRIALAKYGVLAGTGAALAPGRWNRSGEEAIYTSLDLSTCVLERLAHTPKSKIPDGLASLRVRLTGTWTRSADLLRDPRSSATRMALLSLNAARDAFGDKSHPAHTCIAVAIPSVIVPVWNMVLYPQRTGFWDHVTLESVEAFDYDPRLFPADAVLAP